MNAWPTIVDSLVPRIGWTLMHSVWEGALIAAGLWIVLRLLRDATAPKRYAACCCALALTIAAAGATFVLAGQRHAAAHLSTQTSIETAPMGTSLIASSREASPHVIESIDVQRRDFLQFAVLFWAAGVAVIAVRHIGGWAWLMAMRGGKPLVEQEAIVRRLARGLRITRIVPLIETARLDVPAVIGVLRPVILIPIGLLNDLTPQQVEAILAHELAHIVRHDYLFNLLQTAVETLMFYHPAVWWMSTTMRGERENCCDDIAAQMCANRSVYASALARLEKRRGSMTTSLAPAATGGELLQRIRRVLRLPPLRSPTPVRSIAVGMIVLACLAAPVLVMAQRETSSISVTSPTTKPFVASNAPAIDSSPGSINAGDSLPKPATTTTRPRAFELPTFRTTGVSSYGPTIAEPPLRLSGTRVYTTAPSTQPLTIGRYVKIIIGKSTLVHDGKPIDLPGVEKLFAGIPRVQRHQIVLEVAAAAPDVTVERFFSMSAKLSDIGNRYGLAYLSQTGITPTTEPAATQPSSFINSPQLHELIADAMLQRATTEPAATQPSARSERFDALLKKRYALENLVLQLSRSLGPQHPAMIRAKQQLDASNRKLDEIQKLEQSADEDSTLSEFLKTRDAMEFRLAQLRRNLGDGSRVVQDAMADLELQRKRIDSYAAELRKRTATTQP